MKYNRLYWTGFQIKKRLCYVCDYKTIDELQEFYRTSWLNLNALKSKHPDLYKNLVNQIYIDELLKKEK